jgi:hypothetical protein
MSEINDLRGFLETASADAVEYVEVPLPGGRTVLAKNLLWSEADAALQGASKQKVNLEAKEIGTEVEINLARYNALIVAYGGFFRGKGDATPVRVFNPKSEADIRKIEALPREIFKPWLDAITAVSSLGDEGVTEAKNDLSETENENSILSSHSVSDAPTLTISAAA